MGSEIDPTSPGDTDVVADFPADERANRSAIETLIATEHYEGAAGNDRHKIGVYANDAARDAVITSPASGNFSFQVGTAPAANAPRMLAESFHDGTEWFKGYFVPTGAVLFVAYDPSTPPEGFLPCDGAAVSRTTYADLFAVIGTAFDNQFTLPSPAGTDFRVPMLDGSVILGLAANKHTQAGYVMNVSGLNDLYVSGPYTGSVRRSYLIGVVGAGTPDFVQIIRHEEGTPPVTVTASVALSATVAVEDGLVLNWGATTGHAVGDQWTFAATPEIDTVGTGLGASVWNYITGASSTQYALPDIMGSRIVLGHVIKT